MAGDDSKTILENTFCKYPFDTIDIMPSGAVKPCCAFEGTIQKDGRPMSVYEHSIGEIWRSEHFRSIRRDMLAGRPVKGCGYCYRQEKAGMESRGTRETRLWRQAHPDVTSKQLAADNYSAPWGYQWLDLDVGNLCNLKCRMCSSTYSSAIAADPIHSRWAPPGPVAARWRGNNVTIAPSVVLGVSYDGLARPQYEDGILRSWMKDRASVSANIDMKGVSGIDVRLFAKKRAFAKNAFVTITANDSIIFSETINGVVERSFDLPALTRQQSLVVAFKSSRPIAIEAIKLTRCARANASVVFSRSPSGEQWHQNTEFMHGELLNEAGEITRVRLIGGEPLLIKEVRTFLRHFIDRGIAKNIEVMITTNGTQWDEDWADILSQFRLLRLGLSLDGVGAVNEYIRFPSKWSIIDDNITKMLRQPRLAIWANMTVQAYNVLHVPEVIDYCEQRGIEFSCQLMEHPPHISVRALPQTVRDIAINRLRSGRDQWACQALIDRLANSMANISTDEKAAATMKTFTRELDQSRGQNLAKSLPDLAALIS